MKYLLTLCLLVGGVKESWSSVPAAFFAFDRAAVDTSDPLERSIIVIPFSVPLDKFLDQHALDAQAPMKEAKRIDIEDGKYVDYYWERDPFRFNMTGNTVTLATDLRYRANYWQHFMYPVGWKEVTSCGEGGEWPRRLQIQLTSTLTINNQWQLNSLTVPNVQALNACNVSILFFHKDVTGNIRDRVLGAMLDNSRKVDAALPTQADMRSKVERYWKLLCAPIALGGSPGGWLMLHPSGGGVSAIRADNNLLEMSVVLVAEPTLDLGAKPDTITTPLPDMIPVPSTDGFHIALPIHFSYEKLSTVVQVKLRDTMFTIGPQKSFRVTDVKIEHEGEDIVVTLGIAGDFSGQITLKGRLKFDPVTGILSLTDLAYAMSLNDPVLNWLGTEASRRWLDANHRVFSWSLQKSIDEHKDQLQHALNRRIGDLTLSGTIDSLRLIGVRTGVSGFTVSMRGDGKLSCSIN
jgi:hypothetical protein